MKHGIITTATRITLPPIPLLPQTDSCYQLYHYTTIFKTTFTPSPQSSNSYFTIPHSQFSTIVVSTILQPILNDPYLSTTITILLPRLPLVLPLSPLRQSPLLFHRLSSLALHQQACFYHHCRYCFTVTLWPFLYLTPTSYHAHTTFIKEIFKSTRLNGHI